MNESLSALYMRDPETAAILRRQAMAQQLARAQNPEIMYRSAASPWVAGLQALAGNLGSMMAERDLGDLSQRRNAEANEFMANALAGVGPGMGQGASPQPQQSPQAAPARMGGAAIPAVSSQPLPPAQAPADLASIIQEASRETGIPAPILTAQIRQESNFDPNARGRSGEIGLMQIMPSTARRPGFGVQPVDPARLTDPRENILTGARYLAGRGRASGVTDWNDPAQQDRALAAYNGGGDPNYVQNVRRWLPQDGSAPAAIPASASAPQDAAPAGGQQAPAGGLSRERMVMAAMQGMNSNNPVIAERSRQLLQMAQALPQREGANYSFQNIGGTLYAVDPRNPNNRQALGPAGSGEQPSQIDRDRRRYIELDARRDRLSPGEQVELESLAASVFGRDNVQVGPSGIAIIPAPRPSQSTARGGSTVPAQAQGPTPSGGLAAPVNDAMPGAAPPPTQRSAQAVQLPDGRTAQYIPAEQPAAAQPNAIAGQMLENANGLRQARLALQLAEQRPQSFGFWQGAANTVPGALERIDPDGVQARALAANLGSLVIHQRSGAAVTAAEFPRLRPFIPQVGDPPNVVQQKVREFVREYEAVLRDQYEAFGPASGYRSLSPIEEVLRGGPSGGGQQAPSATGQAGPQIIQYDSQGRRVR